MGIAKLAGIYILVLSSCSTTTDTGSWKRSDATITYSVGGQSVLISDSGSFSPVNMIATYRPSDSLFCILGRCFYDPGIMISFVFRTPETGSTALNFPAIRFYYDTVQKKPNRNSGNAIIYSYNGAWSTDPSHTGTITITNFDSANHVFSGHFEFNALDTTSGNSDTIAVVSGIISKMRVQIN